MPMDRKKIKSKLVLCIILEAVLVLLFAVLFLTQSKLLGAGEVSGGTYSSALSGIGRISEADPRVVDLAMLGSHDATTCCLDGYNGVSGEVNADRASLYQWAWGLSYRYTKTQVSTVYEQLMQGARFLHIKCSYSGGVWYGSHSLLDGPIETYIGDVVKFLQGHPGEIAVLELQLMHGDGTTLSEFLSHVFGAGYGGKTLADFVPYCDIPLGELTYNDVTAGGTRGGAVAVVVQDKAIAGNKAFFDFEESAYKGKCYGEVAAGRTGELFSKWFNRMDSSAIAEGLQEQSEKMRADFNKYRNGFRVMQINTTPNLEDAAETVGAWSLIRKAKDHNPRILADPAFDRWMEVMPVIVCDFVTSANGDFNRNINEKIRTYNQNLVDGLLSAKQ